MLKKFQLPFLDEEKMVAELHHHNCLSLWKTLVARPLHTYLARECVRCISSSVCNCSGRSISKLRVKKFSPTETVTSMDITDDSNVSIASWKCFTYDEIAQATNNFHPDNIVGRGGYSEVYKGIISGGQVIAVKKIIKGCTQNREEEFLVEIGIMGHIHHPNTVSLIGFCLEGGVHLVFQFYPNGSLASILHGNRAQALKWPIRYKVACGTARGLHYLHKSCQRRIIHRDITASNILLGPDFEPQISDFGLAKWLPVQWTNHSVTPIEGTLGYLAPEYIMHGIVNEKTDVFAFGILLLEIISGRRPCDKSQQSLVSWARPILDSGSIQQLVDPELHGSYNARQMQCMALTAALCVRQSAICRPTMSQVLELLCGGYPLGLPYYYSQITPISHAKKHAGFVNDYSFFF
eukprot:c21779_g1_i1 orf=180-1400(-)